MTEALPPGPLVNGDWLQANLDQPRVRILDGGIL